MSKIDPEAGEKWKEVHAPENAIEKWKAKNNFSEQAGVVIVDPFSQPSYVGGRGEVLLNNRGVKTVKTRKGEKK